MAKQISMPVIRRLPRYHRFLTELENRVGPLEKEAEKAKISTETKGKKKTYATSDMSKLTRNERKIVGKIMTIITDIAPKDVAEEIIAKIKKEMR